MMHLIFGIFFLLTVSANAQTYAEKQAIPRNNLLKNPGFESGVKTGWTLTAGTLTADSTNELEGVQAASIALSAVTGTVITQTVSAAECGKLAGQNLELSAYVRTASSTVQVCSMAGGSEVQCSNVASTDTWGGYTFNLPAVASTSCGIRIKTSGSTTGTVKVDKAYVGLATNIGSVAQATLYGGSNYVGVSNCIWTTTSGTYANFSADADCNTATGINNGSAPSTKIPAVTFASLPPGDYLFVASDFVLSVASQTTNTVCGLRFSDGTNSFGSQFSTRAAADTLGGAVNTQLISRRTYTAAQTNLTVQIQGQRTAGDGTCQLQANNTDYNLTIHAYRYPSASEIAIRPADAAWYVDANISGSNPDLGVSNVSSYTEITNGSLTLTPATGSAPVGAVCSSTNAATTPSTSATTCSAGSEGIGFNVAIPRAGVYEVCGYFSHQIAADSAGDAVSTTFQWVETPTNSQILTQEGRTRLQTRFLADGLSSTAMPVSNCSLFNFSSSGVKGLRMMYEQAIDSSPIQSLIIGDEAPSLGQRNIRITMKPFLAATPAPLLVGSVTYNDTVRADGAAGLNTVAFGSFTPTLTNGTNVANSTLRECRYSRLGNMVSGYCWIGITCTTAAGTNTQMSFTTPVTSAFTTVYDVAGPVTAPGEAGFVFANTSPARITSQFNCNSTSGSLDRHFSFQYVVK